jgi:hypothetical protein
MQHTFFRILMLPGIKRANAHNKQQRTQTEQSTTPKTYTVQPAVTSAINAFQQETTKSQ